MPYHWGGRRILRHRLLGPRAAGAGGLPAGVPRDTDMQVAFLGAEIGARMSPQRGDLVFWKGHVGHPADGNTLLARQRPPHGRRLEAAHAAVVARMVAAGGGAITARRRLAAS